MRLGKAFQQRTRVGHPRAMDAIATEQALCALTAYARLLDGKTALYDMTDVLGGQMPDDADNDTNEQPAKTTPVVVWSCWVRRPWRAAAHWR